MIESLNISVNLCKCGHKNISDSQWIATTFRHGRAASTKELKGLIFAYPQFIMKISKCKKTENVSNKWSSSGIYKTLLSF